MKARTDQTGDRAMGTKTLATLAACLCLAVGATGCADRVSVARSTIAASTGSTTCQDITTGRALLIAQGTAYVIDSGSHALNLAPTIALLQRDLAGSPSSLRPAVGQILDSLSSIQASGAGDTVALMRSSAEVERWCADNGDAVPEVATS